MYYKKVEIYIPHCAEINNKIYNFTEDEIQNFINKCVQQIISITDGVSVREEYGYFKYNDHINEMNNSIIYFYIKHINKDIKNIIKQISRDIINKLYQECTLVTINKKIYFIKN